MKFIISYFIFLFMFRMENMVALLKIVLANRKHLTLFKFKFVNNVRVLRVFLQLKSHHQLLYLKRLMIKQQLLMTKQELAKVVKDVRRRKKHHLEVEDVMHRLHHPIQRNIYSSLLSSLIAQFRSEEKQKYLATFKVLIHNHVGIKVNTYCY